MYFCSTDWTSPARLLSIMKASLRSAEKVRAIVLTDKKSAEASNFKRRGHTTAGVHFFQPLVEVRTYHQAPRNGPDVSVMGSE